MGVSIKISYAISRNVYSFFKQDYMLLHCRLTAVLLKKIQMRRM